MTGRLGPRREHSPPGEGEGRPRPKDAPSQVTTTPAHPHSPKPLRILGQGPGDEPRGAAYQLPPRQVGASPEVIEHHAEQHRRRCGPNEGTTTWTCPCGEVLIWQCKRCRELVFWSYRSWCEHAAEFWADVQGGEQ